MKIVHKDIKATNVLLDRDLNAKISNFGLNKLDEEVNMHISTRLAEQCRWTWAAKGYFTLWQTKATTGNFNPANKIGEGSFDPVCKVIYFSTKLWLSINKLYW